MPLTRSAEAASVLRCSFLCQPCVVSLVLSPELWPWASCLVSRRQAATNTSCPSNQSLPFATRTSFDSDGCANSGTISRAYARDRNY